MVEKTVIEKGYMEFSSVVRDSRLAVPHDELLRAMDRSQIHTFGWPVGIVMHQDEWSPKPFRDGIRAIVHVKEQGSTGEESYDYWTLNRNGNFYVVKSFFEDMRSSNKLFLDTRIVRITETFLRMIRLYEQLGVELTNVIGMNLKHGGLSGRELTCANPERTMLPGKVSHEDVVESTFSETLGDIDKKLIDLVFRAISDITVMFNYFTPSREDVVAPLVNNFKLGKVG